MKTNVMVLPESRSRAIHFLALTKPRLNFLVVVTAGFGYYLGVLGNLDFLKLLYTVIGIALVAGSAAVFNQIIEHDLDATMERTRRRPIPSGNVRLSEAWIFAAMLSVLGTIVLVLGTNWIASTVALVTLVSYILIYTPLKRRTSYATLVGAIPGALPPVIGWTAARASLDIEAWVLFGIVFLWQMPHFYSLSWLYRKDFKRAHLPLLAVRDSDGRRTSRQALAYTLALIPMSLIPTFVGLGETTYLAGASVLGIMFLIVAIRFAISNSTDHARELFIGSLIYLPLLWGILVVEHAF